MKDPVGLLAGAGNLPEILARAVRRRGRPLVCVLLTGENPVLEELADVFARLGADQWEHILDLWQAHQVREVVVSGRMRRVEILESLSSTDSPLRAFLAQLPDRRDQSALAAVAGLLQARGITVADQAAYIPELLPEPGLLAGRPLAPAEERDVQVGLAVARALAAQDVGQTVVLKHGVILAAEAAEGTDATIRRGGVMAPDAVVVKVSRPAQDPRFDIPTVGPETIEAMQAVQARVLAIEARRTIVVDRPRLAASAAAASISVVAVDAAPLPRRIGARGTEAGA